MMRIDWAIMVRLAVLVVATVSAFPGRAAEKNPQDKPAMSIPEIARFYVDNHFTVGIAGSVLEGGTFHDFTYGVKDYETGEPVDDSTYFALGSATKVFTVTLLARDIVLKKISLTQKVSHFFPEFEASPVGAITIEELATHSSGLPRMPANFDPVEEKGDGRELIVSNSGENDPYKDYSLEKLFEALRQTTKLGAKKYLYSNVGVALLSAILSKINGEKPYADMVHEFILEPLKLTGVQARWTREVADNIAAKYDSALQKLPYWTDLNAMNGTGVVKITLAGMKQWVMAQLYPERLPSPLREAVLLTQEIHHKAEKFDIGLGWFFDTIKGNVYQNHNGSTRGFVNELLIDHKNRRALIYFSNSDALEPGLCILGVFAGTGCEIEEISLIENENILEDRYVILEKDEKYASLMVIRKHQVFDFYYLMIDSDIGHRLFYNPKQKLFFTEQYEYALKFYENGHGEISEGVDSPHDNPFFRLKFIHEQNRSPAD